MKLFLKVEARRESSGKPGYSAEVAYSGEYKTLEEAAQNQLGMYGPLTIVLPHKGAFDLFSPQRIIEFRAYDSLHPGSERKKEVLGNREPETIDELVELLLELKELHGNMPVRVQTLSHVWKPTVSVKANSGFVLLNT